MEEPTSSSPQQQNNGNGPLKDTPFEAPTEQNTSTPLEQSTKPLTNAPVGDQSTPKKSHTWMYLIIIILIIVVGFGVWYIAHKDNTNKTSTTTKKDISLLTFETSNNPLNVFYPSASSYGGPQLMNEQMFEGLVKFNNGTQIVPDLATSWTNPNSTTWIFKLEPNVYYHDGDVVTAQDVVYSWQQINAQDQPVASFTTSTIKNVQAMGNNQVEVTTTSPDPVLLNRLTGLWILDSKAPKGTQAWELGTGAYTVKPNTTPTANSIDLVAFTKWHGGHIYTRAVNYVFTSNISKATSDLLAGKVDLIDGLTSSNISQISKNTNLKVFYPPSLGVTFIGYNTLIANAPTANPKIREAIDLTVNPADVLKALGASGKTVDQVIPPQVTGYSQSIARPTSNLTTAKQLVQSAYPSGCTVVLGIGEPFVAIGQEMAKELAPVGITLKLDVATDEGTFFNNISNGTYQAFGITFSTNIIDGSDVLSYWQGVPYYNNPTFNAQLTKADGTFDPAQRLADLQQASQTLVNDNAYLPLFQSVTIAASKKDIVFPLGLYDTDIDTFFSSVYQK